MEAGVGGTREGGGAVRPPPITTTDLWKLAGLVLVLVDHWGLFFAPGEEWWRVPGRLAAPIFFFFVGFARRREVPATWIGFGLVLTGVETWTSGEGLGSVNLNILINFAWLRLVRPSVEAHVLGRPLRVALVALAAILLLRPLQPILEYGTEGWLWALFGAAHRFALDTRSVTDRAGDRVRDGLALLVPAVYAVKEILDQEFGPPEAVVLVVLLAVLSVALVRFERRRSRLQPPSAVAPLVRVCGRRSLEIYAVTLLAMQIIAYALGTDTE